LLLFPKSKLYFALQSAFIDMKNPKEQLDQIKEIRNIMERSSRFISLSGLSGVSAGFFALAGVGAFYVFQNSNVNYGYSRMFHDFPATINVDFVRFCLIDAALILFCSLLSAFYFTTRNAKSKGQTIWDATARRLITNLAIPLVAGGLYCLVLLNYRLIGLIAPTTLIFYGIALVSASKYTLDEIRWLGISEIVLGLINCVFIGYGVTFWAIGFGILHIIYGLMMYVRYESKPQEKKYW
jgi:hypothetical protein